MKKVFWKIITVLFWIIVAGTLVWKIITYFDEDFWWRITCPEEPECYSDDKDLPVWSNDSIDIFWSSEHLFYVENANHVCVLDSIEEFWRDGANDSSLIWYKKENLRGYFSPVSGMAVIPAQYDKAWFFREGKAAVLKDNHIVFINEQGEVVLDDNWEDAGWVDYVFRDNRCVVCKNDKLGMIDGRGKYLVKPEYIDIIVRDNSYLLMKENFVVSRYDWNGKLLQPMCYYDIEHIENEEGYILDCYAYSTAPNHVGLMDADGNILCPPCYRRIRGISDNFYLGYRDEESYRQTSFGELISVE